MSADEATLIQERGRAIIQAFSSDLKGELKKAIQEGGFKNGISVCLEKAPAIVAKNSDSKWHHPPDDEGYSYSSALSWMPWR